MPIHSRPLYFTLIAVAALGSFAGCAPSPVTEAAVSRKALPASADVAAAPKDLVERVKRAVAAPPLSLPVEEQNKGTLVTGWKRYRGDFHIAHYWQDRTRFRIEIVPDWDEPAARSKLTVLAETEQRTEEGQRWDREPRIPRPERAREALKAILDNLNTSAPQ